MNLRATNPRLTPPRRGTGHAVRLPSWEGLGVGSRVPMHAHGRKGALHEPERRAPVRRGAARAECADLEIGAPREPPT